MIELSPCDQFFESLMSLGVEAIVLFESYVDESGSHAGSPVLCLAGYLLDAKQAAYFNQEWRDVLKRYDLPFFHMSECAHGTGVFKKLRLQERIDAETRMIGIIKRRVQHAFAVTVNEAQYERVIGGRQAFFKDAYCRCLNMCIESVTSWRERHGIEGKVSFIFEAGHKSQQTANEMMHRIFRVPQLRRRHGYLIHSFADKAEMPGLQAADILAWLWAKDYKRKLENNPFVRRDLVSLFEFPHATLHHSEEVLKLCRNVADVFDLRPK